MKKQSLLLCAAMMCIFGARASAVTVFVSGPSVASAAFDVTVEATGLFDGRDTTTDGIISYGFDIAIDNPSVISFLGATAGPSFDAATTEPGTDVFGAASGLAILPGEPEPLILATLHFNVIGSGPAVITISSDLSNLFQGLQYINEPFAEPIAGTVPLEAVPETATLLFAAAGLTGIGILGRRDSSRAGL